MSLVVSRTQVDAYDLRLETKDIIRIFNIQDRSSD